MVQKQPLKYAGRGSHAKTQPKYKAPGQAKPTASHSSAKPQSGESTNAVTSSAQQRILDIFSYTFQDALSSPTFNATLQDVKQALFERDFDRAFQTEGYLEVYAARWSPTRALCYASVLGGIEAELAQIAGAKAPASPGITGEDDSSGDKTTTDTLNIVAVGGGAAEIAALGSFVSQLGRMSPKFNLDAVLLDSGPWGPVVSKLEKGFTTPPPLSKYAGAAMRAASIAMVPAETLAVRFVQDDVLTLDKAQLSELSGAKSGRPCLVTLLFTLNELFTASGLGATTTFLLNLTTVLSPGSLLLVVDSPGSYSETTVGSQAKRYPMQWLLEKILSEETDGRTWTKLQSQDSSWFRLTAGLRYPIPLEDMRYQMHLYKLEVSSVEATASRGDI